MKGHTLQKWPLTHKEGTGGFWLILPMFCYKKSHRNISKLISRSWVLSWSDPAYCKLFTFFKSQRPGNSPSKMTSHRWRCLCQSHCLYLFSSAAGLCSFDTLDSTSWSEDCCWRRSQSSLLELQKFTGRQGIYLAIGQELVGTSSTIALHSHVFEFTFFHNTSCRFPTGSNGPEPFSNVYRRCTLSQPAPPISVSSEQIAASAR